MAGNLLFAIVVAVLAIYGVWAVTRDSRRGVTSARGFSFAKDDQPKRYRLLMAFDIFAVGLLCISAIFKFL